MGKSTADTVKARALTGRELAAQLAQDPKFRRQLVAAVSHGAAARRRARSRVGTIAAAQRLAHDEQLRVELQQMTQELRRAWSRVESRRSHRLRNTTLVLAGLGAAAAWAVPQLKSFLSGPEQ